MPSTSATTVLDALRAAATAPLPWGVAYSGGRDSAVLLWGLAQLAPRDSLVALHVDHGWRTPEERAAEAEVVARWCSTLGVELRSFAAPADVDRRESAARDHRYTAFASFSREHPESPIFLAHHADDQAETVLMRLLQGKGGALGMPSVRGVYRRPLLGLRASVLADAARSEGIPYHEDSTNLDPRHLRNHVRHRVFPVLKRFPSAVDALVRLGTSRPLSGPDADWQLSNLGGRVATGLWDAWSPLRRLRELGAVAGHIDGPRLGRRALEPLCRDGRVRRMQGGGWAWSRTTSEVIWERVVHRPANEYFVSVVLGMTHDVGWYSFLVTEGSGQLAVPGVDPRQGIVWRSVVPGMGLGSRDEPDWGKAVRRKRLGSLHPERCALLYQDGALKAAVDPVAGSVLWSENQGEKLNKTGIFVTLTLRSDYERR